MGRIAKTCGADRHSSFFVLPVHGAKGYRSMEYRRLFMAYLENETLPQVRLKTATNFINCFATEEIPSLRFIASHTER